MAQSIAINASGDIYLDGTGNLAWVTAADAVGQNCVTAIRAQRNEMQYNMSGGMPTAATAFDSYNPVAFEAAARQIMLAVDGVVAVTSFSVGESDDQLNYTASIETIYGPTYIQGTATQGIV